MYMQSITTELDEIFVAAANAGAQRIMLPIESKEKYDKLAHEVGFERPTRKYSRLGRVRVARFRRSLFSPLSRSLPPRTASGRAPSPLPPPPAAAGGREKVQTSP